MKKLVYLEGTRGRNTWRDGFVNAMIARGVRRCCFFNPLDVLPDEDAEQCRKNDEHALESAMYVVYHLGDPQDEKEDAMSSFAIIEAFVCFSRDLCRTVIIFDCEGLDEKHPVTIASNALMMLKNRFPDIPIFGSPADAADWLAPRLRSCL